MLYTSIQNSKIKDLRKLSQKKYRDEKKQFLIEGEHLMIEAYKQGVLDEIFLKEGEETSISVPISYVSDTVMKYISQLDTPPKILGLCHKTEKEKIGNKVLILEDVQDPGNIGTMIRSAVAFGVDTIVVTKATADIYSPKVVRASQGMIFHVSFVQKEICEIIPLLKENIPIIGTKVNGGKRLKDIEKFSKFAIIMGNEGLGVKEETLNLCDTYVYIPMNSKCESLNVGVAASIILYELDKKE